MVDHKRFFLDGAIWDSAMARYLVARNLKRGDAGEVKAHHTVFKKHSYDSSFSGIESTLTNLPLTSPVGEHIKTLIPHNFITTNYLDFSDEDGNHQFKAATFTQYESDILNCST